MLMVTMIMVWEVLFLLPWLPFFLEMLFILLFGSPM